MPDLKYTVGQQVVIQSQTRSRRGEVVKVGRTLLHVKDSHGRVTQFRLATGQSNDDHGYWRVSTEGEIRERNERQEAMTRLRALVDPRQGQPWSRYSTATVHQVCDVLEASGEASPPEKVDHP